MNPCPDALPQPSTSQALSLAVHRAQKINLQVVVLLPRSTWPQMTIDKYSVSEFAGMAAPSPTRHQVSQNCTQHMKQVGTNHNFEILHFITFFFCNRDELQAKLRLSRSFNATAYRACSLLLASSLIITLPLTGDHLPQHDNAVSIHERNPGKTFTILEGIAY